MKSHKKNKRKDVVHASQEKRKLKQRQKNKIIKKYRKRRNMEKRLQFHQSIQQKMQNMMVVKPYLTLIKGLIMR